METDIMDTSSDNSNNEQIKTPDTTSLPIKIDYTPNEKSVDISKAGDSQKLYKEIITPGQGDENPGEGMEVKVNYTGRLPDGTVFDSSEKHGTPFTFSLGQGSVIQGWDVGVATMKKNEKCLLVCHPDYAYGSKAQGEIPSNSTLYFEVELLSWQEEDLTSSKSGGILRRKLVAGGSKYNNPNEGADVEIHLQGYYGDKLFEERDVVFNLGEGSSKAHNVPYGIEKALYKFTENEKSRLTLQPKYAFGVQGNAELGIPPNAVVSYIVELQRFTKAAEAWSLNGQQKMECSREFKKKGTDYFSEGQFRLAVDQYKKIGNFLKAEALLEGEEETERKSLLCAGNLNQSICYLKLGDHFNAKKAAEEALALEPQNLKGLFRIGLAHVGLQEPEEAKEYFQRVLKDDPKNKVALQQIGVCNQQIKLYKEKEKQIYGKMFDKFAKSDNEKEKIALSKQPNGLDDLNEWKKSEKKSEENEQEEQQAEKEKEQKQD